MDDMDVTEVIRVLGKFRHKGGTERNQEAVRTAG